MPRDGANIYNLPFPDVVDDTTIESPVYNGFTNDVAQDLNTPRPIVAGGTGANNVGTALFNLSAEKAAQVVTNYDSQLWVPGSFYSASSATAPPVASHAFSGIAYIGKALANPPTNANVTVEARDTTDGKLYIRRKVAGVWGSWTLYDDPAGVTAAIALKVAKAGDVMTGALELPAAAPTLGVHATNKTYVDAGDTALTSAKVAKAGDTMTGALIVNGNITSNPTATTGGYYFGNGGTKFLNYDGTQFNFNGGQVVATAAYLLGGITSIGAAGASIALNIFNSTSGQNKWMRTNTSGALEWVNNANSAVIMSLSDVGALNTISTVSATAFGAGSTILGPSSLELGPQSGGATLSFIDFHNGFAGDYDARIIASGGTGGGNASLSYTASSHTFNNTVIATNVTATNTMDAQAGIFAQGHRCRAGTSGGYGANWFNLLYNAGPMQLWADATNLGNISVVSDYRTKKDVTALPSMWKTVKQLRPIKYTQKDFSPPSHKEKEPFIAGDNVERWGFMAHELQETLIQNAATGVKDSPDHIQSPNWPVVVAALTKALQEAMARIEALEAK